MTPLNYCQGNITFRKTSDITGSFQVEKYRFLENPLADLSNPGIRRMVIYKAASCMGTVFAQCAMAYRIERELGDMMFVAQTDDDAAEWTVTRGKEFILRMPSVDRLIPRNGDKVKAYAITNALWQFVHKFVLIGGPGAANQQSKQVRFLITDESHLVNSFPDGTLTSFEKRMGNKWNRASLHVTTAADKGREVDKFYYEGQQNEFHLRCLNCNELYWPLWEDDAKAFYNGARVFHWRNEQSDTMTLESLREICPHCSHEFQDSMQIRHDLQTHGGYIAQNPNALAENQSYRWSCFAYYPIQRREVLAGYLTSLRSEKMGDLKPMEDFIKKRLCQSYEPRLHGAGETSTGRDYKTGDVWITDERLLRTGSFDVQDEGGFHLWGQCDDFRADGSSRRIAFAKLESWQAARQFQVDYNIESEHCGIDTQHRHAETLARCAEWLWYGFRSSDERSFVHHIGGEVVPNRFFSECEYQDSLIGKSIPVEIARLRKRTRQPVVKLAGGQLAHTGFCFVRVWSKQNVGMLLMRLKSGESGRYFGVATDLDERFVEQLHSYVEAQDVRKRDGAESVILRQIKHHDHSFATTSQSLILAMVAGHYPLAAPIDARGAD